MEESMKKALIKRAAGYIQKEISEEYIEQEGKMKLVKRKVVTKDIPPDLEALKIILSEKSDYSALSDEELESELENLKREISGSIN